MANPITVGVTAIVAIARNPARDKVRFQNTGATTLYFTRQRGSTVNTPSTASYDFLLAPGTTTEANEAFIQTNSISQFNVVSSAAGGILAVFETVIIRHHE